MRKISFAYFGHCDKSWLTGTFQISYQQLNTLTDDAVFMWIEILLAAQLNLVETKLPSKYILFRSEIDFISQSRLNFFFKFPFKLLGSF